jgi:hypothetical protein
MRYLCLIFYDGSYYRGTRILDGPTFGGQAILQLHVLAAK